jgi:hypothetical protein
MALNLQEIRRLGERPEFFAGGQELRRSSRRFS